MNSNLESDRGVTAAKMYPIDLAPQKITIVKSVSNAEVKMAHLIPGQPKTSASTQILSHGSSSSGLMRPGLAQIISSNVASQPQMIVSGSPILQGAQIVSQGSQIIGQGSQMISQSQLITHSGQLLSPGTQIISQGTQLSAAVSNSNNSGNVQVSINSSPSCTQVLNVGGQLVSGAGNLVVNSSVRTLPPTVRVVPPLPQLNTRPVQLSNVTNTSGILVNKGTGSVTSHVPRGLAAGASLAVRPVTPVASSQPASSQGGAWSVGGRGPRSALVYGARPSPPRIPTPSPSNSPSLVPHASPNSALTPHLSPATSLTSHISLASQLSHPPNSVVSSHAPVSVNASFSTIITLPTTSVLSSNTVISSGLRGTSPRPTVPAVQAAAPRALPLVQRNYQPAKVVGVASVGVRGVVGNSAPTQLYYEVPRVSHALAPHHHRPLAPYAHAPSPSPAASPSASPSPQPLQPHPHHSHQSHQTHQSHQPQQMPHQVNIVNALQSLPDSRPSSVVTPAVQVLPRPSILRKRDIDGSPTKTVVNMGVGMGVSVGGYLCEATGWEDVRTGGGVGGGEGGGSGGSTTISASSSPARDEEPEPPRIEPDVSPRKKPRKQVLTGEVRQCEFQSEEPPHSPPLVTINPPKRPQLSSGYVCGWRGTALHFVRPGDVRRREPRAADIVAIAARRHVLTAAHGWKVHHLTAQMDDLMTLESDVGEQLANLLRALETASGRALSALKPHSHTILELFKGNIQRSKIVCEEIQEAREDILRVFTHRDFVSDILTRQADKRCFRKHRSQS